MIELKNINKSYGKLHVLKDVSLTISKKEILCIEGPSGAGKTTLLKIIGKLENMDSGNIIFDGEELNNLKSSELCDFRNQKIGFVFQFHHLMPEFTVFENICMPSFINGRITESKNYALKLMEALSIQNKKDDFPSNLSGGEQQRVAIARSIIMKPELILADEPTGNLDSENSELISNILFDYVKEENASLIMVTHDNKLANLSKRIIKIKDGKIQ